MPRLQKGQRRCVELLSWLLPHAGWIGGQEKPGAFNSKKFAKRGKSLGGVAEARAPLANKSIFLINRLDVNLYMSFKAFGTVKVIAG